MAARATRAVFAQYYSCIGFSELVQVCKKLSSWIMTVSDWAGGVLDQRSALGDLLGDLKDFISPAFHRSQQCVSASAFIDGLLSGAERKAGWMLAQEAGLTRPCRIQSLPGRSRCSGDVLCERVRRHALDALGTRKVFWGLMKPVF
jgi:hypothetical protein